WVTTIDNEVEFGVSEQQLWFLWRLEGRTRDQLEASLDKGRGLFKRGRGEIEGSGGHTYQPGPRHARLQPSPHAWATAVLSPFAFEARGGRCGRSESPS